MSLDAMKQALEALEHEAQKGNDDAYRVERDALRAAIQQAQEPMAWMTFDAAGEEDDIWYDNPDGKLLEGWTYKPLYTSLRQWQGLTDEELWELWNSHTEQPFPEWFVDFKRAYKVIAEKLKEKNV